jgi:hypothetical protein
MRASLRWAEIQTFTHCGTKQDVLNELLAGVSTRRDHASSRWHVRAVPYCRGSRGEATRVRCGDRLRHRFLPMSCHQLRARLTARRDPARCGPHAAPNRVTRASPPVVAAAAPRDAPAGGSPAPEAVPPRDAPAGGLPAAGSAPHAPAPEALPPRAPAGDIAAPDIEAVADAG